MHSLCASALFTLSLKYSCSFKLSKDPPESMHMISNNVCSVPQQMSHKRGAPQKGTWEKGLQAL